MECCAEYGLDFAQMENLSCRMISITSTYLNIGHTEAFSQWKPLFFWPVLIYQMIIACGSSRLSGRGLNVTRYLKYNRAILIFLNIALQSLLEDYKLQKIYNWNSIWCSSNTKKISNNYTLLKIVTLPWEQAGLRSVYVATELILHLMV
jgi:hypothetical protein